MRSLFRARTLALIVLFSLPWPAAAQMGGDVQWSAPLSLRARMTAPTVGPDGTVYMHADDVWAFNPDGTVKWSLPLFGIEVVDVGSDGTVYTGSIGTVNAYHADGSLKWTFTEPLGGQGILAGPNVGPDGHIYVITDSGGMGAISFTTEGTVRWNVPGFWDREGRGESTIAFGTDRFFFAESHTTIPECLDALGVLTAVSFEGQVLWCSGLTVPNRPVVAPNGNVYVSNGDSEVRAYSPDGAFLWFFDLPLTNSTVIGPSAGPNSEAYAFQTLDDLWAVDANGNQNWMVTMTQGNTLYPATVSADNRAMVFGSITSTPPFQGHVIALDPTDGSFLWDALLPDNEGVAGPATFSADGSVVYVPVSNAFASRLVAYHVHDAAPGADFTLTVTPQNPPVVIPPGGGTFLYDFSLTNQTALTQTVDIWITLTGPGVDRTIGPVSRTMNAGASLLRTFTQTIPGNAPAGAYTLTGNVGLFPIPDLSASFAFEKTAAKADGSPGSDHFASDFETRLSPPPDALPTAFGLKNNFPNPFNPTTRIAFSLPEATSIRLAVYDMLGRRIATLAEGLWDAGTHAITWHGNRDDGASVAGGVYLYRLDTPAFTETRTMTLLK